MSINGKIGTVTYDDVRARGTAHHPVLLSGEVKASNGTYPVGLIVSRDTNDDLVEYEVVADEVLDAGDGSAKTYTGTLTKGPILPGSVAVTDGTEAFTDDGLGRLTGAAGGTGTVVYSSGALSVTFNAAVTNEQDITVDYQRQPVGVMDEEVDTSASGSGLYIVHGSVLRNQLKVGISAQAAPTTAQLATLRDAGIFAE